MYGKIGRAINLLDGAEKILLLIARSGAWQDGHLTEAILAIRAARGELHEARAVAKRLWSEEVREESRSLASALETKRRIENEKGS